MALADKAAFVKANWRLDEASGNAVDSVNGYNGVETGGTVATVTGKLHATARDFELDDTEQFLVPSNTDLQTGDTEWMVRFWVKFESLAASCVPVGKLNGSTGEFQVRDNGAQIITLVLWQSGGFGGGTTVTASTFGALSTGVWYLIHAGHRAGADQAFIAVNGTADVETYSSGTVSTSADFTIGSNAPAGVEYIDGAMDDLIFMKGGTLDATEMSEDYNGGTGVPFADWAGGGAGSTGAAAYAIAQQ